MKSSNLSIIFYWLVSYVKTMQIGMYEIYILKQLFVTDISITLS